MRVLALPDLERSKAAVLNSLTSKSSQRTSTAPSPISWTGNAQNRGSHSIAPSSCDTESISNRSSTHRLQSINLRLAAVRRAARMRPPIPAYSVPNLRPGSGGLRECAGLESVSGTGSPTQQGTRLLASADCDSLRGKGNCSNLAMLIGCGLRRGELFTLQIRSIQLREKNWGIADLLGRRDTFIVFPVPWWVKDAVGAWKDAGGIPNAFSPTMKAIACPSDRTHARLADARACADQFRENGSVRQ